MIVTDEKSLRTVCEDASLIDSATSEIIKQLKITLDSSQAGVGLAAPQIGYNKKIFVANLNEGPRVFVNSNIVSYEDPYVVPKEGCLSFPGEFISTVRFKKIEIEYMTEFGEKVIEWHSGFGAHVIQHEHDHVNGILMFDRRVPQKYDLCFCGSRKKFKFCCKSKLNA